MRLNIASTLLRSSRSSASTNCILNLRNVPSIFPPSSSSEMTSVPIVSKWTRGSWMLSSPRQHQLLLKSSRDFLVSPTFIAISSITIVPSPLLNPLQISQVKSRSGFCDGFASDGFTCILVAVDRFSKACWLIPLKGLPTAMETTELLFNHVFQNFSIPEDIVSLSSGYHPQSNGQKKQNISLSRCVSSWLKQKSAGLQLCRTDVRHPCTRGWNGFVQSRRSWTPGAVVVGWNTLLIGKARVPRHDILDPNLLAKFHALHSRGHPPWRWGEGGSVMATPGSSTTQHTQSPEF